MNDFRKLAITVAAACALGGPMSATAQTAVTASPEWAAQMDQQMTAMRSMHDQMASAKTPAERNALMAAHRAVMQNGMQMMGGMGPGMGQHGMAGMGPGMGPGMGAGMSGGMGPRSAGPGAMPGQAGTPEDWAARQLWMEKRMEMMQSMMQMMVDRMPAEPAKK
jgi:hypothetical protein